MGENSGATHVDRSPRSTRLRSLLLIVNRSLRNQAASRSARKARRGLPVSIDHFQGLIMSSNADATLESLNLWGQPIPLRILTVRDRAKSVDFVTFPS